MISFVNLPLRGAPRILSRIFFSDITDPRRITTSLGAYKSWIAARYLTNFFKSAFNS